MVLPSVSYHRTRLLYVGFYLTLTGVAAAGLSDYFTDGHELWWAAASLLLVFTLLAVSCQWPINFLSRYRYVYLTVQTGLVLGLLILPPETGPWAVLYLLLSVQGMLLLPQRIGFLWLGVFTLAAGAGLVYGDGWVEGLVHVPLYGGGHLFFGTFAAATARADGFVPQELAIYPDLTATENLRFFARLYGVSGKEARRRIDEVLEIIGLAERADDMVKEYSGGMKRRLNIGIGLLHHPRLLVLDEPTVGVDPQSRNAILESVERLADEGIGVLYTTHYMGEAERLCDRVGIVDLGELKAEGTRQELGGLVGRARSGPVGLLSAI